MGTSKTIFEKNPKKTLVLFILYLVIVLDITAGIFLIPKMKNSHRVYHYYYHHDLAPNMKTTEHWGSRVYPVFTNSMGFKDKTIREIPLKTSKKRIVFMAAVLTE